MSRRIQAGRMTIPRNHIDQNGSDQGKSGD